MTTQPLPTGPGPEAISRRILETWPETDLVEIPGASFFSLDAEKHFPNFATIVTTDEFDDGRPFVWALRLASCGCAGCNLPAATARARTDER
jgi:hypothetical protein